MILNLNRGITSLLLKITKLVGNHQQEEQRNSVSSEFEKSQSNKGAALEHFFPRRHTTSLRQVRKVYERPYERFEREYGHMENIYECHSSELQFISETTIT